MYLLQQKNPELAIKSIGSFRRAGILFLALAACVIIAIQAGLILIRGEAFCPDDGCRVVENFAAVKPLTFNFLGLFYFLTVLFLALRASQSLTFQAILRLFLLVGLAAEGILFGYQAFVVHEYCMYCLLVMSFILGMNLLGGAPQVLSGMMIIGAELAFLSLLSWNAGTPLREIATLDAGTCAVRTCDNPNRRVFLIFSEHCPHCHEVIKALERCTACEFHFNPLDRVSPDFLPGLAPTPSYSPEINAAALKILGIQAIPVLVAENDNGLTFIKGQREIIEYVERTCTAGGQTPLFAPDPLLDSGVCDPSAICN